MTKEVSVTTSAPSSSSASPDSSAPSLPLPLSLPLPSHLLSYFASSPLTVATCPLRGRYLRAARFIPRDSLVFEARSYAHGIHPSFRKRVCDRCGQFNMAGRYELHCQQCQAVYYCSVECQQANDISTTSSTYASPDHRRECRFLKRVSQCKLEKGRIGVMKLIIRMYHMAKDEQEKGVQIEAPYTPSSSSSSSSSSSPPSGSSVTTIAAPLTPQQFDAAATTPTTAPTDTTIDAISQQLSNANITASTYPPPSDHSTVPLYRPLSYDVSLLIGHPPPPVTKSVPATSHQLDHLDIRRAFEKVILSSDPSHDDYMDIQLLMRMLAQVESNAFGMYQITKVKGRDSAAAAEIDAAPTADHKGQEDDIQVEQGVRDNESSQSSSGCQTNSSTPSNPTTATTAAASSSPTSLSVSSSPSPSPSSSSPPPLSSSSSSRYIGVLLYPTASYFNHSCSPNLRVAQLSDRLVITARDDIHEGDETCIEYIDCNRPVHTRHAELLDLYRFQCACTRCREELTEAGAASPLSASNSSSSSRVKHSKPVKVKVSYATPESRLRSGAKKGKLPKKKKIEPKYHNADLDIDE